MSQNIMVSERSFSAYGPPPIKSDEAYSQFWMDSSGFVSCICNV